jgi:hypothetical protein
MIKVGHVFWGKLLEISSAEWLLTKCDLPNGGEVILLRSVWISVAVYFTVMSLSNVLDPGRTWTFNIREIQIQFLATLPRLGAIFAVTYAALYARFASQWTYIANVYNQIKATECRNDSSNNQPALAEWKAGFIEDARALHLAYKSMFASVILSWTAKPDIKRHCVESFPDGEIGFSKFIDRIKGAIERSHAPEKSLAGESAVTTLHQETNTAQAADNVET